jgi:hypothetical protein
VLLTSPGKSSVQAEQPTESFLPEDLWSAAYEQLGDKEQKALLIIQLSATLNYREESRQTALLINEVIQLTEKQYEDFQQRVDGRF